MTAYNISASCLAEMTDEFKYYRVIYSTDSKGNPTSRLQGAVDDKMEWGDIDTQPEQEDDMIETQEDKDKQLELREQLKECLKEVDRADSLLRIDIHHHVSFKDNRRRLIIYYFPKMQEEE